MVIKYGQNSFPLIALPFVDIRHSLHECEKELNVVRRRHTVVGVIDIFPKNGMEETQRQRYGATKGPITWYVSVGVILSVEERLRFPTIRRRFSLSLAAEFLPVPT